MSLEKRRLQKRYNLRQSVDASKLLQHQHSLYSTQCYTFGGGRKETTTNNSGELYGNIIELDPFTFLYAVRAEVVLTCEFNPATSGEYFYLGFEMRSEDWSVSKTEWVKVYSYQHPFAAGALGGYIFNVNDSFTGFFKSFNAGKVYIRTSVSNSAYPLVIYGAHLRIVTYQEDTYGEYTTPFTQGILTAPTDISEVMKVYADKLSKESYLLNIVQQ